jgi:MSHA biogenesis protein MshP
MSRQRGSSLVVALFLIVVVALLAAFAVTVNHSQRDSASASLMADRALAAARTGIEWAAYRSEVANGCADRVLVLNEGALRGFRVAVRCTPVAHTDTSTYTVYDVESIATFGTYGNPGYASRTLKARFLNPP